ncbi:MAG TPA: hypothetical protein VG056_12265 [Pirellulales bacterium]|jgi:hypothetical protein|nr:hypothetical protein [Pirellulales bacterium]
MFSTRRRSLLRAGGRLLAVFLLAVLASNACSAAIIITAPTVNLPYSPATRSGSFEVYVQSTETSPPQVGADNIELQLPATPGVTFTLPANAATTSHLYLFRPQTPASLILKSGQIVEGTDFAPSSLATLVDGSGLLLVDYQVAPGAFGNFPLTLISYPPPQSQVGTALFNGSSNPLAATLQNGSINISAPVPEPATWVLAIVAALGIGGYLRRTRLAA